ncbi:MAG: transcriptional repressor [Myxococcales bacterium]|nr:transcriptional repressor [Myxococcales bacterium]
MARHRIRHPSTDRSTASGSHRHDHTIQAEVLLRERGLKVTTPRLLVLKALLDAHRPTSAQELLDSLAGEGLDQVTVYRTLTTLTEIKLAQQVSTIDGSRRFEVHVCDGCRVDHPHLQCRVCGALDCLEEGVLPTPLIPTRLGGYLIDDAKLYLFGTCPACQGSDKERRVAEKPAAPVAAPPKTPRSARIPRS